MYKVRYRKFKVGTDHTTLLVGSWTVEILKLQGHYYRLDFIISFWGPAGISYLRKCFRRGADWRGAAVFLERQQKAERTSQAMAPQLVWHTVHLRTPENDCWSYWTLLAPASPNPGSMVFAQLSWPHLGLFPWVSVHFSSAPMIFIIAALTEILTYHGQIVSTGTQNINTSCYKVYLCSNKVTILELTKQSHRTWIIFLFPFHSMWA